MRQIVIILLVIMLYMLLSVGCNKKTASQENANQSALSTPVPSVTPTQVSTPDSREASKRAPSPGEIREATRDSKLPENIIFLWGTINIPEEPVKIKDAKDLSGKELEIYTYPNLTINAECNGEKIKADATINKEKVITIVLKVKNSYKSYSKIKMLSFEIPGYSKLELSDIPLDKNGSVNLKTLTFAKNH